MADSSVLLKSKTLTVLFFVILQMLVIVRNISVNDYTSFFWYCDVVPLLFAIAFLIDDEQLVKALVNVGLFSQLTSLVSLSAAVFFHYDIVGFTDILRYSGPYIAVSFLLHLTSVNVAFLLTWRTKPRPRALAYSLVILALVFAASFIFATPLDNINYVRNTDFLGYTPPFLSALWIAIAFVVVVLPTQLVQWLVWRFAGARVRGHAAVPAALRPQR